MDANPESVPHGHLTLGFEMKSYQDFVQAKTRLIGQASDLRSGADAAGILHDCRVISLDDRIVYLIADYDGYLERALATIGAHLGSVIGPLLLHTRDPPPSPISDHLPAFVDWARRRHVPAFAGYVGAPGATAQHIKALAARAGIGVETAYTSQRPLLVIMPMRSGPAIIAVAVALKILICLLAKGADGIGTVHFAHVIRLPNTRIGCVMVHDDTCDESAQDFSDQLGPAFDLLFRFTKNPSPSPTSRNTRLFTRWVHNHTLSPLLFYSAYPGLQALDVKALLAGT